MSFDNPWEPKILPDIPDEEIREDEEDDNDYEDDGDDDGDFDTSTIGFI